MTCVKLEESKAWLEVQQRQLEWRDALAEDHESGDEVSAWRAVLSHRTNKIGLTEAKHVRVVLNHTAIGVNFLTPSDYKKRQNKLTPGAPMKGHRSMEREWIFKTRSDCLFACRIRVEQKMESIRQQAKEWRRIQDILSMSTEADEWTSKTTVGRRAVLADFMIRSPDQTASLKQLKSLNCMTPKDVRACLAQWKKRGYIRHVGEGLYQNISLRTGSERMTARSWSKVKEDRKKREVEG